MLAFDFILTDEYLELLCVSHIDFLYRCRGGSDFHNIVSVNLPTILLGSVHGHVNFSLIFGQVFVKGD